MFVVFASVAGWPSSAARGWSSGFDDLAHGVVEGEFEDVDEEVDGVAFAVVLRPAPIGFFEDEAGKGGQLEVTRLLFNELEAAFLKQWHQKVVGAD